MQFEGYLDIWTKGLQLSPKLPPPKKPTAIYMAALLSASVVTLGVKGASLESYFFVAIPLTVLALLAMRKNN